MGKTLWEVGTVVGTLVALIVLSVLVGDSTGTGGPRRRSGGGYPWVYRPTGGNRGFGTRGYEHHR